MQFKLWLEGRFDKETTDISRIIIKAIKENIDKISEQKNVLFFSGDINSVIDIVKKPDLLINLPKTDYNLMVLVGSEMDFLSVSGRYNVNRNLLRINILIPTGRSQFPYIIDKLIPRLKNSIRHELEHSTQEIIQSPEKHDFSYFSDPNEVAAYVSGLYKMAKTLRKSFTVILDEFLDKVKISDEEKEKLKEMYLNYQKTRFPKAF
jgi:hypothetical protein